jgi:hypothetical protein
VCSPRLFAVSIQTADLACYSSGGTPVWACCGGFDKSFDTFLDVFQA